MKKDRIQIFKIEIAQDAGGGVIPNSKFIYWETWAKVKNAKVKRDLESFQTDLEIPKEFTIMFRSDKSVTKNMLINYNG